MDIQFSGAIDFATLFNGMNQTRPMQTQKTNNNAHSKMLEEQNQIMSELNANTQMSIMNHFASRGLGQNVNVIA